VFVILPAFPNYDSTISRLPCARDEPILMS